MQAEEQWTTLLNNAWTHVFLAYDDAGSKLYTSMQSTACLLGGDVATEVKPLANLNTCVRAVKWADRKTWLGERVSVYQMSR